MKREVKIEQIPEFSSWDDTISWVGEMNDIARMGGTIATDMAQMIPFRLKGEVRTWFSAMDDFTKAHITQSWPNFFQAVVQLLGTQWSSDKRSEFYATRFRQEKHRHETPLQFINRCIQMARILIQIQTP